MQNPPPLPSSLEKGQGRGNFGKLFLSSWGERVAKRTGLISSQNGNTRCYRIQCPALQCASPVTDPQQCCPRCLGRGMSLGKGMTGTRGELFHVQQIPPQSWHIWGCELPALVAVSRGQENPLWGWVTPWGHHASAGPGTHNLLVPSWVFMPRKRADL